MRLKYLIRDRADTVLANAHGDWLTISEIAERIENQFGERYSNKQIYNSIVDYEAYIRETTNIPHTYCLPL